MTVAPAAPPRRAAPLRDWLPYAAIGAGVAALFYVWLRFGLSLPGLAVLVPAAAAALLLLVWLAPQALAALVPALLPLPAVWILFPYELVFALFALLFALDAVRRRAAWMLRLDRQETAHLLLCLWGTSSAFWAFDAVWYVHGFRRLWIGLLTFAVARRMAHRLPRGWYEASLLLGPVALAGAALVKRFSVGLSDQQASLRRVAVTDLGWGTANYIATLLLLFSPVLIEFARRRRDTTAWIAWPTLGAVAYLQGIIASRAAAVLWAAGSAIQVVGRRSRAHALTVIAALAAVALFLLSPLGQNIVMRFTSLRELGSMAVRVWYWRVAWQRVLDFWPWGMGLNQGWSYPDRLNNVDPHNYWLAMGFELGLPGLALWAAVLVLLYLRLRRMAADPEFGAMGRALQIAFWMGQLHTLVEPTFQGPQYQFVFFWIMGGWIGYWEAARALPAPPAPSSSR